MPLRTGLLTLVAGFLAAGCAAAQPAPVGDRAADGQPRYGGVFRIHEPFDPYDWDITYTGKAGGREGNALALNSLLGFKTGPEVGYNQAVLRPELAERWEVNPDATSFTFHLRKGARFANVPPVNGREFTSADVRWSFEYLSRTGEFTKLPAANTAWMLEGMERVETPYPYTAVVRFKEPFAPFLSYVAHDFVHILAKDIYEQEGHFKDRLAGTGAFQLDAAASQKGSRWVFKKNPTYWDAGKPYIDEVHMLVLPDDATAHAAFQTKQLDWLEALAPQEAQDLKAKTSEAVVYEFTDNPIHLYMNNSRPPFDNPKVRKALSLAINRDEFIKVLSAGAGAWALAGSPVGLFSADETKQMLRHDPAEARRLLAEAGFPEGLNADIHYPTDAGQRYITHMELLQSQLKRAGINLAAKGIAYSQFSPLRKRGEHSLQIIFKDVTADPDSYLFATFHPSSANNYDRVNDPRVNDLLVAQRREADPTKRRDVMRQAVRHLNADCYCGVAVYYGAQYQFWQPYLQNYSPNWHVNGWAIEESWLNH